MAHRKRDPAGGDGGEGNNRSRWHTNLPSNNQSAPPRQEPIRAELTGSTVCTAAGITVNTGSPVLAMCRALIAAGYDPATPLHTYRGDTLCLTVRSIGEGARLLVKAAGHGPPVFAVEERARGRSKRFLRRRRL
jgi:hypothetical protein